MSDQDVDEGFEHDHHVSEWTSDAKKQLRAELEGIFQSLESGQLDEEVRDLLDRSENQMAKKYLRLLIAGTLKLGHDTVLQLAKDFLAVGMHPSLVDVVIDQALKTNKI